MANKLVTPIKIVFDTNILISTFLFPGLSAKVYDHCALYHELYTSDWILKEFDEKMTNKFRYSPEQRSRIIETLQEQHIIVMPTNDLPADSPDPDDNNILQTALFVNADFLITGDAKHLLPLKQVGSTQIISPREFYELYIT